MGSSYKPNPFLPGSNLIINFFTNNQLKINYKIKRNGKKFKIVIKIKEVQL
jgi:hypothetical protein